MKKINLDESQLDILERFAKSKASDATLIREIMEYYINELGSVKNIDRKGNMGLQSLAMILAGEWLEEIYSVIFSPESGEQPQKKGGRFI